MAKNTLTDLLAQRAALDKQIAEMQRDQRAGVIAEVQGLMAQYGLSLADVQLASPAAGPTKRAKADRTGKPAKAPRTSPAGAPARKVAPKYRDPATGDTWSGRGLKPRWLSAALASGRSLSDFAL
jgi:DNA-binding protein H-NS